VLAYIPTYASIGILIIHSFYLVVLLFTSTGYNYRLVSNQDIILILTYHQVLYRSDTHSCNCNRNDQSYYQQHCFCVHNGTELYAAAPAQAKSFMVVTSLSLLKARLASLTKTCYKRTALVRV
jgi:hypothetical protein